VKGIQVCSNKGSGPLQRGDNHKNVKMGRGHLRIFFSKTIGPILTRLGANYPWVKGIQIIQKKEIALLHGDIIEKELKCTENIEKSSPEPTSQNQST
jgi:hypothetical protein